MSIPGAASPLFLGAAVAEAAAVQIDRSLRFNSADSAYLNRTPSSAGNRKTWTWSGWIKRSKFGSDSRLFDAYTSQSDTGYLLLGFSSANKLIISGWGTNWRITSQVFRDPSAFFHLVVAFDVTQSTASDRIKFYINGQQVDDFDTNNAPAQDTDHAVNGAFQHNIGRYSPGPSQYFDGYLADVHFIDGQALAPTDFGKYDDDNNWNPKAFSGGSYGTNGFHLDFSDNTSTTTIAEDSSGNNNDWTANNLSVASGAGNDSLIDTPTNYDDGTNVGGNYATLNPLQKSSGSTLSNGSLDISMSSAQGTTFATMAFPASGKWYFECTANATQCDIGIAKADASLSQYLGKNSSGYGYYIDGNVYNNDASAGSGASYTTGDIIGVAFDADAGTCKWYKNNSLQVTISSLSGEWFPAFGSGSAAGIFNFGARPFAYTPPSNHLALVTSNLTDPTIADGSTAMDVRSNLSAQFTINDLGFEPGLVVAKSTSHSEYWIVADKLRNFIGGLRWNDTNQEGSGNAITNVGATGYQSDSNWFTTGRTYATFNWNAGTSTATNTDGSITSNVRANQSAGFSIVTYEADAPNNVIGHGLNAEPYFVITKARDRTDNWLAYHYDLGVDKWLHLNLSSAPVTTSGIWGTASNWTNSTFGVSTNSIEGNNYGSHDYVAYCWAPVSGFSFFGSYVGNGSSDGTFVYTGHRSRFLLIKALIAGEDWVVIDTERETYNTVDSVLFANDPTQEITNSAYNTDILSNGFKLRGTNPRFNTSGETYVFASFAEHPFKTARAR